MKCNYPLACYTSNASVTSKVHFNISCIMQISPITSGYVKRSHHGKPTTGQCFSVCVLRNRVVLGRTLNGSARELADSFILQRLCYHSSIISFINCFRLFKSVFQFRKTICQSTDIHCCVNFKRNNMCMSACAFRTNFGDN
jgi:hypothetical protein